MDKKDMDKKISKKSNDSRNSRHFSSLFSPAFFVFFVIIIGGLVFLLLHNPQARLATAQYDSIVDGINVRGLLLRKEQVIRAPISGKISFFKKGGSRVAYGEKILKIENSREERVLYNEEAGVVCFAVDGLENLSPATISSISLEEYNDFERNYRQIISGEEVEKSEPVFRIVHNYNTYLLIKLTFAQSQKYKQGEKIFIRSSQINNNLISGQITHMDRKLEQALAAVKLDKFVKEWINQRWVEMEFIKDIYRGITIPRAAIFTDTRGTGVLISTIDNKYKYKKVTIKNKTQSRAVVSGIEIGDKVILNPQKFDYGRGDI